MKVLGHALVKTLQEDHTISPLSTTKFNALFRSTGIGVCSSCAVCLLFEVCPIASSYLYLYMWKQITLNNP